MIMRLCCCIPSSAVRYTITHSRCTGYRPILDAFRVFAKTDSAAYSAVNGAAVNGGVCPSSGLPCDCAPTNGCGTKACGGGVTTIDGCVDRVFSAALAT